MYKYLLYFFFTVTYGDMIQWTANNKYCVNVKDGKSLQIWSCSDSDPNFQFVTPDFEGVISWHDKQLCLEVVNGCNYNGNNIQLAHCDNTNSNQIFKILKNNVIWKMGNKCLDVANGQASDGVPILIWDCKNNNNQIFNILNKNSIPREYSCNIMDKPLNNRVETDNNNVIGWSMTGATVGFDWCKVNIPSKDWIIKKESTHRNKVKILSYNLFWWNLYGKRQGNQASASKLISNSNNKQEFDILGFQECENIDMVLSQANIKNDYTSYNCGHAVAIAFNNKKWTLLSKGTVDVAEDKKSQYYGKRIIGYVRILNKQTNAVVFFINHHGPLPVNSGGLCESEAVVYNILKTIGTEARKSDSIILVGDFNADKNSKTIQKLKEYMYDVFSSNSFGGVDHIFSNNNDVIFTENLGNGGSDHEAITATISI